MALAALAALSAGAVASVWWIAAGHRPAVEHAEAAGRTPRISPDYVGIVLPPNIAPLNFSIREEAGSFLVRMRGEAGEPIEIVSHSPRITIPLRAWRSLLAANRGQDLSWEVYAESAGAWRRYDAIVNHVAEDEIDPYLVHRLVPPVHNTWDEVGIYQRSLETFDTSAVLDGKPLATACVNCHAFCGNAPDRMLVGLRSNTLGKATLLADNGHAVKLGMAMGYSAWHPTGRVVAYSTNKVRQFFHTAGPQVRDVVDLESGLSYLRVADRQSRRIPGAADDRHLATYPAWSPDGHWLYYCRAPRLWTDRDAVPPKGYAEVKYDLVRIAYDVEADQWGRPETVLAAKDTGRSILLPRISPDGRFLLFCMCRYGCFPAYQPSSDLYLMDLEKGTYAEAPINSEFSESWHSWSSNSRWIAFSSKRGEGTFTRCYLSYVDRSGRAHKPFVVPQADPEFYDAFLKTFSVPELVTGPVPVAPAALMRAARSESADAVTAMPDGQPEIDDSDPYRQARP
jgi:hypothetical protein